MKKTIILALVASMPLAAAAQKAGKKELLHEQFTGQGYGMAGCGLGSVVFGQKKGPVQIVAATLNGIGYQSIAITFGTSNCSEPGIFGKADQFIDTNKVALENDIVRGGGETLASLTEVMQCQDQGFASQLKQNYVAAFPQGGASSQQISALALKSCAN